MSAKKKSEAKERRKKEKRARKAAQKARYQAYKEAGNNQKSKRQRRNVKGKTRLAGRVKHAVANCGNAGCKRCNPVYFKGFLNTKGEPEGMPHWMWLQWKKAA